MLKHNNFLDSNCSSIFHIFSHFSTNRKHQNLFVSALQNLIPSQKYSFLRGGKRWLIWFRLFALILMCRWWCGMAKYSSSTFANIGMNFWTDHDGFSSYKLQTQKTQNHKISSQDFFEICWIRKIREIFCFWHRIKQQNQVVWDFIEWTNFYRPKEKFLDLKRRFFSVPKQNESTLRIEKYWTKRQHFACVNDIPH